MRPVLTARDPGWNMATSIELKADARRVFQALTLPEYLEAWIAMPEQTPDSSVAVFGEANGFRLIHSLEGRVVTHIAAYFLAQRLRALRLYWRKTSARDSFRGLVDFRIREQVEGCMLEVRHSALASAQEHRWHRMLWQGSLRRLASLLRAG